MSQRGCKIQAYATYRFPYVDTFKTLFKSGPGCLFYGFSSASELDEIDNLLSKGERFLALFCEMPTNPLRHSPDLEAVLKICRRYDIPVVIDDTLSTAVNVDLLGERGVTGADVIWTSLSKSFSGIGNVMGGRCESLFL
jgi:cystathionine gamma-synthase